MSPAARMSDGGVFTDQSVGILALTDGFVWKWAGFYLLLIIFPSFSSSFFCHDYLFIGKINSMVWWSWSRQTRFCWKPSASVPSCSSPSSPSALCCWPAGYRKPRTCRSRKSSCLAATHGRPFYLYLPYLGWWLMMTPHGINTLDIYFGYILWIYFEPEVRRNIGAWHFADFTWCFQKRKTQIRIPNATSREDDPGDRSSQRIDPEITWQRWNWYPLVI